MTDQTSPYYGSSKNSKLSDERIAWRLQQCDKVIAKGGNQTDAAEACGISTAGFHKFIRAMSPVRHQALRDGHNANVIDADGLQGRAIVVALARRFGLNQKDVAALYDMTAANLSIFIATPMMQDMINEAEDTLSEILKKKEARHAA